MTIYLEKLEACPKCGTRDKDWVYDAQRCLECGYWSLDTRDQTVSEKLRVRGPVRGGLPPLKGKDR